MIHAMIAMAIAAAAWPLGFHSEAATLAAAFYCGREHAQAENRAIKSFYGGKRENSPWWCGFELRAWNAKSLLDWLGPIAVVVIAMIL